jgi:hypothetical protein
MIFLPPSEALYREQRQKLAEVPLDERMEYEELAAHLEYDCGVKRGHAEREAYCRVQWARKWHTRSYYPDFQPTASRPS